MAPYLEERLCSLFGYASVALTGYARAALVALLESLEFADSEPVIIPTNACPAVVAAIAAAKARPVLVPVSGTSGLADDMEFVRAMEAFVGRGMVMPTHLYGARASYANTLATARARGWFVLENDTMATSAVTESRSRPDALLVSFGTGKTIDAGGGGALLMDDTPLVARIRERVGHWPAIDGQVEAIETHLTLARRHLRALGRPFLAEALFDLDIANVRRSFSDKLRPALDAALDDLPSLVERRRQKLAQWDEALADLEPELAVPTSTPIVPWRAIRWMRRPPLRGQLMEMLRSHGIDVGTNYPHLAETYPNLFGQNAPPMEDLWGRSVLNFWLTDDYDLPRIHFVTAIIREFFDRFPDTSQ